MLSGYPAFATACCSFRLREDAFAGKLQEAWIVALAADNPEVRCAVLQAGVTELYAVEKVEIPGAELDGDIFFASVAGGSYRCKSSERETVLRSSASVARWFAYDKLLKLEQAFRDCGSAENRMAGRVAGIRCPDISVNLLSCSDGAI